MLATPSFPAGSLAITLITNDPTGSEMLGMVHCDVPCATPRVPQEHSQRTSLTPEKSNAVPRIEIE